MNNQPIIDKINDLSLSKDNTYFAIHGTSFNLIKKLISTGEVANGGNFDNLFYLLVEPNIKGIDIEESALFYANVNAIKDYIKEKHIDLVEKIYKNNFDPYLYTISIGSLMNPIDEKVPKYLNFLSKTEIAQIKKAILETKKENRLGVILKFSANLKDDFKVSEISISGQTKILLSKPLTIDYLSSIELIGAYEKQQLSLLTK